MSKTRSKVALPRHTGRYNFVLTPLADAMFQLLIFFMLSSNLAPYSLLTVRTGVTGQEGAQASGQDIPDEIAEAPPNAAIWTVGAGEVVAVRGLTRRLGQQCDSVRHQRAPPVAG